MSQITANAIGPPGVYLTVLLTGPPCFPVGALRLFRAVPICQIIRYACGTFPPAPALKPTHLAPPALSSLPLLCSPNLSNFPLRTAASHSRTFLPGALLPFTSDPKCAQQAFFASPMDAAWLLLALKTARSIFLSWWDRSKRSQRRRGPIATKHKNLPCVFFARACIPPPAGGPGHQPLAPASQPASSRAARARARPAARLLARVRDAAGAA